MWGLNVTIDCSSGDTTTADLDAEDAAERDALEAAAAVALAEGTTRNTNEADARQRIKDRFALTAFQNNVKGKTDAEIETWLLGLSQAQLVSVVAQMLGWERDVTLAARQGLDALTDATGGENG